MLLPGTLLMSLPESYMGSSGAGEESLLQPNTLLPTGMGTATPSLPINTSQPVQPTPDPWQTVARMLRGFQAGTVGQPNPVIQLEQQQQRLEQQSLQQKIQQQQFDRLLEKDGAAIKAENRKVALTTGWKLIESPNTEDREWGYQMLKDHGALAPTADPKKLALVGKLDYKSLRDDAIGFIENGIDPAALGEQYRHLPLDEWKKAHAQNPFALNEMRTTKRSVDDVVKTFLLRARTMTPEQVAAIPGMDRQIASAESLLGAGKMPDYGNAVNTALGSIPNPATPGYGWNPKTQQIPRDVLNEAMAKAQTDAGPPTVDRDIEKLADLDRQLANPENAKDFGRLKRDRDETVAKFRAKQQARMELQRMSREDLEKGLENAGYKRGTPEWTTAYLNAAQPTPLQQGGSLIGPGNIIAGLGAQGTGLGATATPTPPIALGPVPPTESSTTKDIISAAMTRKASQEVMSAIQDPTVKSYIGKWAQHKAEAQRMTPYEWLGKIPPAVVKFEQNLATVQNYTIKLITGAQMGEREADRIQKQMPQQGNQTGEFITRMEQTLENQLQMEKIILTMALRGDQKAKALASDLGLLSQGNSGSVIPSSPPGSAAPEGTRQPDRKRVRNTKNPAQTGTLAPGAPLPPGWEFIQ